MEFLYCLIVFLFLFVISKLISHFSSCERDDVKREDVLTNNSTDANKTQKKTEFIPTEKAADPDCSAPKNHLRRSDGSALREEIKKYHPSRGGLYPHEILLLSYAKSFTKNQKKFQSFWYYQYLIPNVPMALESLMKRGFLDMGDMKYQLGFKRVVDLKEVARAAGLKVSGRKEELIDRIVQKLGNDNYFPELDGQFHYRLTPLGNKEIADNEYVLYIHRTGMCSMLEMNEICHKDKRALNEVVFDFLKDKAHKTIQELDTFNVHWTSRFAEFCLENNLFEEGLESLCFSVYRSINIFTPQDDHYGQLAYNLNSAIRKGFPYERGTLCAMTFQEIGFAKRYKSALPLNDNDFRTLITKIFESFHKELDFFMPNEVADVFFYEINDDIPALESKYLVVKKRLQEKFESHRHEFETIRQVFLKDPYKD